MHAPRSAAAAHGLANPADHMILQDIDSARNLVDLFLKLSDLVTYPAAIGFKFSLTRPTSADAARET